MTGDGPMELLLAAFSLLMLYQLAAGLTDEEVRGRWFAVYTRRGTPVRYWTSVAGIALCLASGLFGFVAVAVHLI